jgi:hypothetical protein
MNPLDPERAVETALTEALQRLPQRRAPAGLVRRVERVLAAAPAPRQPSFSWPRPSSSISAAWPRAPPPPPW